jgi:hypothetical protein
MSLMLLFVLLTALQMRTGYMKQGILMRDPRLLLQFYMKKKQYMDIASAVPLEIIFLPLGYYPALRFNRLLKIWRWIRFEGKFENRSNYPNIWRLVFLMHKLVLIMHFDACAYYELSKFEGFGLNEWVIPAVALSPKTCGPPCVDARFSSVLHSYLASLSWATTVLMVCDVMRCDVVMRCHF